MWWVGKQVQLYVMSAAVTLNMIIWPGYWLLQQGDHIQKHLIWTICTGWQKSILRDPNKLIISGVQLFVLNLYFYTWEVFRICAEIHLFEHQTNLEHWKGTGDKSKIFGPNILIILGGSKSFGTHISGNHLGTSLSLIVVINTQLIILISSQP